ncbi:hypothetical protein EK21DRAFT_104302 [Setomelanomma holmii]|uniref:DUF7918 domain-containing protein n=1 Tax=Setomelanomma holmii TaxID=210430 RepID=A0A9P4GYD7_9PLEO|nr:hypothetical protein EK21DRAFT_104302 [Setomelanomma holmii]
MPSFRSINIALHSQFDVQTLPEFYPLPPEHYISPGICCAAPQLVDDATSTCTVYIPTVPGSTFWISYSISPPVPEGHHFLFKLYINGAHILSWSTGKDADWRGKTMFGLYERSETEEGKPKVEKRVLCFTSPSNLASGWDVQDLFDERACMEIKVHRAHGRKRIERELQDFNQTEHARNAKGISLVNAGRVNSEQPKRFYKFALIDPGNQPFATFRYLYRSWDQLRYLGLLDDESGEENDISVIEPGADTSSGDEGRGTRTSIKDTDDVFYQCGDSAKETQPRLSSSERLRAYIPRGAPDAGTEALGGQADEQTQQRQSGMRTPTQSYRLSIPPSVRLNPTEQTIRPLPTAPQKSDSSSTAYCPHPAYPIENWRVRTRSPVKSVRDGISTPPLEKDGEQGTRASSLMSVITSTWKRRGTPSSERHKSAEGRRSARSEA